MNKIILSGNICQNIELAYTKNGTAVIQNFLAVKNDFKSANGEYETNFINIVAYKNTAEYLSKYAEKGSKVLLSGALHTRNYISKAGNKVYVTEVIVENAEVLTYKKAQKNEPIVEPQEDFNIYPKDLDLPF